MKVLTHFAGVGFSNTYLVSEGDSGDAVLIDPGKFDVPLLSLIEDNNFYITAVLISHSHENHINGIKTLLKIYDSKIYAGVSKLYDIPCTLLRDGDVININGIDVQVIKISGHSSDSFVYHIDNFLFTGDVLSAGRIGTSTNNFARANLINDLQTRICTLDPMTIIFPGHGPPTTLKVEKEINSSLYEEL